MTLTDLKNLIKTKIEHKKQNIKLYNIIYSVLEKHNGKRLDKKIAAKIDYELVQVFGAGFFKCGIHIKKFAGMTHLELSPVIDNGYSNTYLIDHAEVNVIIDMGKIAKHNTCWSNELDQLVSLQRDLLHTDYLKKIVKNMNALNKANEYIESLNEYDNNCEFYYEMQRKFNTTKKD